MEAESIEAGAVLCRWFAREAQRIYSLLNESEEARETRKLVEFIQARGGRITTKELQKSNSRKYSDAETATQDLDRLVQTGLGYWQDRPTDSKGGRPTRDFFLHPTTDDTDETPGAGPPLGGRHPTQRPTIPLPRPTTPLRIPDKTGFRRFRR